jgi:hypothetical protein
MFHSSGIHGAPVNTSEIVVFTKSDGPLTKKISIKEDGTIQSDGSACQMARGVARRALINGVNDLANLIANLNSDQALGLGRLRSDLPEKVGVVTKNRVNGLGADIIARTNTFISYDDGTPAYALLDFDTKGMPPAVVNKLASVGGFLPALQIIIPELRDAACVLRLSTSAGLFRADTGQRFKGSEGRHLFVLVKNGADIDRFLRDLHRRCWLHGFGWLMIGKGGAFLERSIVDRMVGAPERLVFEGAPILVPPLGQDPESRRPIATEGEALDTVAACPPLTIVEKANLAQLIGREKYRLAPTVAKERDKFVEEQAEKIVARTGCSQAAAKGTILQWIEGVLLPNVVLPFDDEDLAGRTVADVLADPLQFEGATLADPLEGVEYGTCKAKVMRRDDGTPWINSFAHGRTIYKLKYDAATVKTIIEETHADEVAKRFAEIVARAHLSEDETEVLRNLVAKISGCGKRTINKMVKEAVGAEHVKRRQEARDRRMVEDKDPRQWIPVPSNDAPWLEQIQVVNEVVSVQEESRPRIRDAMGTVSLTHLAPVPGTHAFTSGN